MLSTNSILKGRLSSAAECVDNFQSQEEMPCLTRSDVCEVEKVIYKYKETKLNRLSDHNVFNILKELPLPLSRKLRVVIATHEGNAVIKYHFQKCPFRVFLMAETKDGIKIFDPEIPNGVSMNSKEWISSVYDSEAMGYALLNNFTQNYLPQFRIMDGEVYTESYPKLSWLDIYTPNFSLKHDSKESLDNPFWRKSFCVNLYEARKLFDGSASYQKIIGKHKYLQSPKVRLTDKHIEELRRFFHVADGPWEKYKAS